MHVKNLILDRTIKVAAILLIIMSNIFYVNTNHQKQPGLIYVLMWTDRGREPFSYWIRKRASLVLMNCPHQNCYLTDKREYFLDPTDYDVILFNSVNINEDDLPLARSDNQMYIFVSTESTANYPMSATFNYFFNYTWTYKLNSDILYPYFVVRNKRGDVVAPKMRVHWMNPKYMKPAEDSVIKKLQNKSIAAAWFVSNCLATSYRLEYNRNVRLAFDKLGHEVDVYGHCDANKKCGRDTMDDCLALVESKYYFYFSFENSFCEDYVTEKVMTAIDHYTVPVVLGGANYSRFLPEGSYLNAKDYRPTDLANKMHEIILDKEKYYEFFKFHRYYTYHPVAESVDIDPLCAFCAFVNDDARRNTRRTYAYFTSWWNDNNNNDTIVKYEDSGPHIKAVMTYRHKKVEPVEMTTTSDEESVSGIGGLISDLFNYFFQ